MLGADQVRTGAVAAQDDRPERPGLICAAAAEQHGAGAVAEQGDGGAVAGVGEAGQAVRSDKQDGARGAGGDESGAGGEGVKEAGAADREVESEGAGQAKAGGDGGRGGRAAAVRGGGGDHEGFHVLFAVVRALAAARTARSAVDKSAPAMCLRVMPVRERIHSSVVSSRPVNSRLETEPGGRAEPTAMTTAAGVIA